MTRLKYHLRRQLVAFAEVIIEVDADEEEEIDELASEEITRLLDEDEIEWSEPEYDGQWITHAEKERID